MAKRVKDAATMAANWQKGMQQAGAKYTQGIQNYQGNPGDVAAQPDRIALYVQNTAAAASSGRLAAALTAPGAGQRWRDNALKFGAQNLATGAAKGLAKYQARATALHAVYQAASDAANALPKTDSVGRFMAAYNVMKAAKGTR
jgi:hypothetical protein